MMDLFKPTTEPKDLAISRAIEQSVEMFTTGDFAEAERYFEMAKEFVRAPAERFAPSNN